MANPVQSIVMISVKLCGFRERYPDQTAKPWVQHPSDVALGAWRELGLLAAGSSSALPRGTGQSRSIANLHTDCRFLYWFLPLPAYSPDLNPIEMAFAKLKALLRKAAAP